MYFFKIKEKNNNYILMVNNNEDFESFLEYFLVELYKDYNLEDFEILYSQKTNKVVSITPIEDNSIKIELHHIKGYKISCEYKTIKLILNKIEKNKELSLTIKNFLRDTMKTFETLNFEDCYILNDEILMEYLKLPKKPKCEVVSFSRMLTRHKNKKAS